MNKGLLKEIYKTQLERFFQSVGFKSDPRIGGL